MCLRTAQARMRLRQYAGWFGPSILGHNFMTIFLRMMVSLWMTVRRAPVPFCIANIYTLKHAEKRIELADHGCVKWPEARTFLLVQYLAEEFTTSNGQSVVQIICLRPDHEIPEVKKSSSMNHWSLENQLPVSWNHLIRVNVTLQLIYSNSVSAQSVLLLNPFAIPTRDNIKRLMHWYWWILAPSCDIEGRYSLRQISVQ